MRFVFIIIVWMTASMSALSQQLSIELSIEWRKTEVQFNIPPFQSDSTVNIPLLKLAYRNLAEQDVYVKKIWSQVDYYPPVVWALLLYTNKDLTDRVQIDSAYDGEHYTVGIAETWEVYEPGFDISKEHERHIINNELWTVHTVLETQQSLNDLGLQKQLSIFGYSDKEVVSYREAQSLISAERRKRGLDVLEEIYFLNPPLTESEISGKYEDHFVFLKAGETYEQEVSLIGFYLLGGNYEFLITMDSLPGYIIGMEGKRIGLPKLVNGYKLYDEDFLTNTVGITM